MTRLNFKKILAEIRSRALIRWPAVSYGALPVIILVSLIIVSLVGYMLTSSSLIVSRELAVKQLFHDNQLRINTEFHIGDNLLKGSAGMMEAESVTDAQWQEFMGVYDLKSDFAGLVAAGVTQESGTTISTVDFVSPVSSSTEYLVGKDLAQTAGLNSITARSIKFGNSVMSGSLSAIDLTRADQKTTERGFLMIRPYYDNSRPLATPADRSQALLGYTFALFRGDEFFNAIYKDFDLNHTKVQIYIGDIKPENLQYQIDNTTSTNETVNIQTLQLYDQTFTVVYTQDTNSIVPYLSNYLPQYLLFVGLGMGVLVGLLAAYMLRSRYRRLVYQKEQDVNFAKDELLSLASHQLRTPATGVKQYLGMVLQGFAGEISQQQRTYLERAYIGNDRQLHVINDILHLAKLESGRIVLSEYKFDISDMLREVVDEQREDAKKGEITLEIQAPTTGVIVGDSHMLRMVFENLLSNAIKYTLPKGIVTVRLNRRGTYWILSVKDTGVGIAKRDLNKLFKQFSRISNSRTEYVTGTGVGLYLSYHLVKLHGGTIRVSSKEAQGSTFSVRIPRKL